MRAGMLRIAILAALMGCASVPTTAYQVVHCERAQQWPKVWPSMVILTGERSPETLGYPFYCGSTNGYRFSGCWIEPDGAMRPIGWRTMEDGAIAIGTFCSGLGGGTARIEADRRSGVVEDWTDLGGDSRESIGVAAVDRVDAGACTAFLRCLQGPRASACRWNTAPLEATSVCRPSATRARTAPASP